MSPRYAGEAKQLRRKRKRNRRKQRKFKDVTVGGVHARATGGQSKE